MNTRTERLSLALVIAFVIVGFVIVTQQSSLGRRSADFTIDYSAALLIREGHLDATYDRQRLGPLMLRLSDQAIDPQLPFDAPLAMALPYVPLTYMPLEIAFHVWQGITFALLVLAWLLLARWISLGRQAHAIGLLMLLGFPATWALLAEGQSSAMLLVGAVLLVGAWLRRSTILAACGGLLLALKPQYAPVYLIVLLMARAWKPLLAAALACLATGLSPLLADGLHGMDAMIVSAISSGHGLIRYNESLIATLSPLLPGRLPTIVGFGLWAVVLLVLTGIAVRRSQQNDMARYLPQTLALSDELLKRSSGTSAPLVCGRPVAIAVLMTSAGVIFAPHALPYDVVLLAVPMWLAFALHQGGEIPTPVPAGFAVAAAMVLDLGRPIVSLAPVAMLACLAIYGALWIRRRAGTQRVTRAA